MNLLYKLAFFIFSFLTFFIDVQSQPIMGFQGGINVSALSGHKNYDENKPRIGITGYLFTDIPLGHNSIVSIETGLAFSQQGMKHVKTSSAIASTNVLKVYDKLSYLILPVYLKENYSGFYTKLGPYAAYRLSALSTWTNTESKANVFVAETKGTYEDFEKNASQYDFGLSFGFGFIHFFDPNTFRNRRHRNRRTPIMQVDFKYNLGLTKLDQSGNIPNMDVRNHTFTVGLSITSVNN